MLVVDVETTGTNPKENSILSIGAVDTIKLGTDPIRAFFYGECTIWHGAKIDQKALEINGFTNDDAKYNHPEKHDDLLRRWAFWIKDSENHTLCSENVNFDADFLRSGLVKSGYSEKIAHELIGVRNVDLHTTSYNHHELNDIEIPMNNSRSGLSLDETLKYSGLPSEPKPHNALIGAILEAEAYWRLMHSRSLFANLPVRKLVPEEFPHERAHEIPNFLMHFLPDYLRRKHK